MLAILVKHEADVCSVEEQKLVAWVPLNRARARNQSIYEVLTDRGQFMSSYEGYSVDPTFRNLCEKCLTAWERGEEAPVFAPYATSSNYQFYYGDGRHNWFREVY